MGLRDEYDTSAVLTAFALVLGAGCATGIGAAAVFSSRLVKFACNRTLAASLGLASGVMLYVSLVDIYGKAISGFQAAGHEEGKAFKYATAGFFGGIFLMKVSDGQPMMLLCSRQDPRRKQNRQLKFHILSFVFNLLGTGLRSRHTATKEEPPFIFPKRESE